jgi:hypothetical protein
MKVGVHLIGTIREKNGLFKIGPEDLWVGRKPPEKTDPILDQAVVTPAFKIKLRRFLPITIVVELQVRVKVFTWE